MIENGPKKSKINISSSASMPNFIPKLSKKPNKRGPIPIDKMEPNDEYFLPLM